MMITTEKTLDKTTNGNVPDSESNILEEKVDVYKKEAIQQIRFSVVIKPAFISFIALIISFWIFHMYHYLEIFLPELLKVFSLLGRQILIYWCLTVFGGYLL